MSGTLTTAPSCALIIAHTAKPTPASLPDGVNFSPDRWTDDYHSIACASRSIADACAALRRAAFARARDVCIVPNEDIALLGADVLL